MRSNFSAAIAWSAALLPNFALGALVSCGTKGGVAGKVDYCRWGDLINMINTLINFLIFDIAVPLAVIIIVVAGIRLVLKPSSATAASVWKDVLWKGVMGLILALAAFLIVKLLIIALVGPSDTYNLKSIF